MAARVSIDRKIKSLRSQKSACTRSINESKQTIANARAFQFDPRRVAQLVELNEVLIAQQQSRIAWIDKRLAELKELSKRTAWIEVSSSSPWSGWVDPSSAEYKPVEGGQ